MEDQEMDNQSGKVPINAIKIISKYKSLKDRLNFCFERNWYHPKEVGFDANFFLKVIMGEKKYLPNNFTVNYKLHYFRKGEKLDKSYIIERMKGNGAYAQYTPDVKDAKKFSKDFLLLLIAFIDPQLYRELYSINKKQLQDRIYNKWGDYQINISNDLVKDIEDFVPTTNQTNLRGGFRKTKNSIPTGTFYKFRNLSEQESKIEKTIKNIEKEKDAFKTQIDKLNEINKINQIKNQKLETENNALLLKLENAEKLLAKNGKNFENNKGNAIKIKLINDINKQNK